MIREDNVTLETLTEDLQREKVTLKEYVTRSEGSALITTVLNKVLLDKYKSHPVVWSQFMKLIRSDGRDVRVPDINAINPAYVPELSEIPFTQLDITSTTIEVDKYASRIGISQEMIDDNEANLLGWTVGMAGTKFAELQDEEGIKALATYYSTGAALDTSVPTYKGRYNRGTYHLTGTLTNNLSASAWSWEEIISTGLTLMNTQTITLLGETYRYPVYPTTILVHTDKSIALSKILRAVTTVVSTGVGAGSGGGVLLLAGSNVFRGMMKMVSTPYMQTRHSYMLDPSRGSLVMVQRNTPAIDQNANWAFDAKEVRGRVRFRAAVTEDRGILPILH